MIIEWRYIKKREAALGIVLISRKKSLLICVNYKLAF